MQKDRNLWRKIAVVTVVVLLSLLAIQFGMMIAAGEMTKEMVVVETYGEGLSEGETARRLFESANRRSYATQMPRYGAGLMHFNVMPGDRMHHINGLHFLSRSYVPNSVNGGMVRMLMDPSEESVDTEAERSLSEFDSNNRLEMYFNLSCSEVLGVFNTWNGLEVNVLDYKLSISVGTSIVGATMDALSAGKAILQSSVAGQRFTAVADYSNCCADFIACTNLAQGPAEDRRLEEEESATIVVTTDNISDTHPLVQEALEATRRLLHG